MAHDNLIVWLKQADDEQLKEMLEVTALEMAKRSLPGSVDAMKAMVRCGDYLERLRWEKLKQNGIRPVEIKAAEPIEEKVEEPYVALPPKA